MLYAGGDLNLTTTEFWSGYKVKNAGDVTMLRRATKNVLYTVSTSNSMNATVDHYIAPAWVWALSALGIASFIGLTVWGVFVIRKSLKAEDKAEAVEASDGEVQTDT